MLLKSLKIQNFRQFIGEQEIDFAYDDDKKITVILGKNTSGKTTLIKSFKWILYGVSDFETEDLINIPVASNMEPGDKEKVKGEIELKHKNTWYIIRREQDYFMTNSGDVKPENTRLIIQYKTEEGKYDFLRTSDHIDTINKILPEDLSDYFFFHGEQVKEIGANRRDGKKNITEAVESILGLEVINSAIKHLSGGPKISVIGKLKNQIDTSDNEELEYNKKLLAEKEEALENIQREISDYQNTIEFLEQEIDELNDKIRDNKPTRNLKNRINDNEIQIKEKIEKKSEKINKITDLISQKSPMYFMQPLLSRSINLLNNFEGFEESIPEMHANSINYILNNRKTCICGTKIEEGSEAFKNLIEFKRYLPPESIGTVVRLFLKDVRYNSTDGQEFYEDVITLIREVRFLNEEIKELESQNAKLSQEIENKPDVGVLEKEVNSKSEKLQSRKKKLEQKISEKGKLERDLEEIDKEIKKLAKNSEKNRFTLHCLDYAKSINARFEEHYNKLESKTRKKLEERTNEIFNKIYHGERNIKLKNNYEYYLETPEITSAALQDKADKSEGLKTVASFSFIAGIVSLAREKIYNQKSDEVEGYEPEPYPLVMDAPFSDTDEEHIKNISEVIPEVAEQTIMIIMEKDWKYAKDVLRNEVNKLYDMEKRSETKTFIQGGEIVSV